jgi:hypothetical protein
MRLSGEERQARDTLVLRMFLAGVTYRDIGRKVGLSLGGVHKVVKRELRQSADRREDVDGAVEAYLSRMEALLSASWRKALGGDVRATNECRRLLDSMGRAQGVFPGSVAERLADHLPPDDDDDEGVGPDGLDELQRYRRLREAKYESG